MLIAELPTADSQVIWHRHQWKLDLFPEFESWHSKIWTRSTAECISKVALQYNNGRLHFLTLTFAEPFC